MDRWTEHRLDTLERRLDRLEQKDWAPRASVSPLAGTDRSPRRPSDCPHPPEWFFVVFMIVAFVTGAAVTLGLTRG